MKSIKDTWNGYLARRRLDQLWQDLQAQNTQQQPLNQFLVCFLTLVQNQPAIDQVFAHRDALLKILLDVLQELEVSDAILKNVLQSLLSISKDIISKQSGDQVFEPLLNISSQLALRVTTRRQSPKMMKQILRFISYLFSREESLKLAMTKRNLFESLLDQIDQQDEPSQSHILNFFKFELVAKNDIKDQSERLSLLSDSSNSLKNNTIGNLISQVKSKVNEISNEYRQELQAERFSDLELTQISNEITDRQAQFELDCPFSIADEADSQNPLTQEQIESLLNKKDSQIRGGSSTFIFDEDNLQSEVLSLLRKGEFMAKLVAKVKTCRSEYLLIFLKVAKVVGCFQHIHWAESEKELLPNLKERFQIQQRSDQGQLLNVFQYFIGLVTTEENRIKDLHVLSLVLKIVKLANQEPNGFEQLLTVELKGLMMKSTANAVVFLKIKGFQWLQSLNFTESLFHLATYLLHILCDAESQCFAFVIAVAQSLISKSANDDYGFKIQLVTKFLQDLMYRGNHKMNPSLIDLVQICFQINDKETNSDTLVLVATCFELQLKMEQGQKSILPISLFEPNHIHFLCQEPDQRKIYIAALIVKCAIHSGIDLNLSFLQTNPRPNLILKLLFISRNNMYSVQIKSKISRNFIMTEYTELKEALLTNDFEKAYSLFSDLTTIVSDSPLLKSYLDEIFILDENELVENLCIQNFSLSQQKMLITFLLEIITDHGFISENNQVLDHQKLEFNSDYLTFVEKSKKIQPLYKNGNQLSQETVQVDSINKLQPTIREIDLTLYMLLFMQASPETLVFLFQNLKQLLVSAQNRNTLVIQGFQNYLIMIIDFSVQLPRLQHLYLRQQALGLFQVLLQQSVLLFEHDKDEQIDALLSPMLFQITTQTLCSRTSPQSYCTVESFEQNETNELFSKYQSSCMIKIDVTFKSNKILFVTSEGQQISLLKVEELDSTFKTLDYDYQLTSGQENRFDLQSYIKLGLFEPDGWNLFTVVDNLLYVNKSPTSIRIDSLIQSLGDNILLACEKQLVTKQISVKDLVFNDRTGKSKINVFGEQQTFSVKQIEVEVTTNGQFTSTRNIYTLRELLTDRTHIRKVISKLEQARGEESILTAFRLLTALSTPKVDFSSEIQAVIKGKLLEMHPEGIRKLMGYMLDFSLGRVDAHNTVNPNDDKLSIPVPELLSPKFLELPLSMLSSISGEQGAYFLEMLHLVLKDQNNLILFFNHFGFKPVLALFTMIKDNPRKAALYETTISITELMINGVRQQVLAPELLSKLVQYLIGIAHEDQKQVITRIVIDCFSVLLIHIVVEESGTLLAQLLNLAPDQFFYSLLQSKTVEIREYAFKIITLLLSKSRVSLDYELVTDLLCLHEQSMNLCMTIIDAACQKFVNVNDVTPTDDALVIQMMNRSQQASKIVNQINVSLLQKKKANLILHFEFLQCFFTAISKVKNDIYRHLCVKQLIAVLQQSPENFDLIFGFPNGLQKVLYSCFSFQIAVTTSEELSYSAKQFYNNHLFERYVNNQAIGQQNGYSTTEDDPMHTSGNKSDTARTNNDSVPPTRSLDSVLDLITQLCVRDLSRRHGESQICNILLMHPSLEDQFQIQIISRVLKHFHKQPKVTERDVLLNMHKIFSGIQKLMSSNQAIEFRIINLINEIAFKSTMEIRGLMKEFKLLELRDQMMVAQILGTYKSRTESLVKQLSQFSFETLASKPLFSSRRCPELLVLLVTDNLSLAQSPTLSTLRQKIVTEVIQFEYNRCLDNIDEILTKGLLTDQESDFLLQRVQEQLLEDRETAANYAQERLGRRRILCDEEAQNRLQRRKNLKALVDATLAMLRQQA